MKELIRFTFTLLLFTAAATAKPYTESGSQAVTNYTPKEYNAELQNWAITQDENGIMYFGNSGTGMLEFDGSTWKHYPVPNQSVILSLANGDSGKLYTGAQGDVGYFLPDSLGKLTFNSLLTFIPKNRRDFSDVWNTYVAKGKVYFNTGNYILVWNIQKREFKVIQPESSFHLMFEVNETIYVREWGKGLNVFRNDSLALVKGGEKFADERIYVMLPFPGEKETSLIATRTMGLFKYYGTHFIPFKTEVDQFLSENLIYLPGTVLSDGNIVLGTLNGGAVVIDTTGREVHRYNLQNGIISNKIYFTFQDRSGAIWLGTDNGISRIDYASPVSYFDSRNNFSASPIDIIRHKGIIYTATQSGVYALDPGTSTFQKLSNSNNTSWSFAETGNELIVGTFDGLFKVETDQLSPIRKTIGNEYNVQVLKQSDLNPERIWVGTKSGLWAVLKTGNSWKDEGKIFDNQDQISSIVEDNENNVWLGTWSSGLFRITFPKDDTGNIILNKPQIEHFDKNNGLQDGYTFVEKINGANCFVTNDSIYRFNESSKIFYSDTSDKIVSTFYRVTENKGWTAFQQDELGRLWIGSKGKLAMGTVQSDGSWKFEISPFNRIADESFGKIYAEKNSVTWFAGIDAIIKHDFRMKNMPSAKFSALVRSVTIRGDSAIYFGGKVNNPVSPYISFKNNSVTFRYSATSYEGKNVNQFKTFLDGFDDSWSPYSTETKKEYTNLPPGEYTFNVAALNILDSESSAGTYSFEILSPWYRTWWAYIFYVLTLGFGIFVTDRIQRRRLVKKERERADYERKTQELEDARQLQLSMLPIDIPKFAHLDIAVHMQTATEVGGDYYDFSTNGDGSINIAIGDATGHGLKAGIMVSSMKSIFSTNSPKMGLEEFFRTANNGVKQMNLKRMMMGFTMLNIKDHSFSLINAGMPPLFLFCNKSQSVEELQDHSVPIGAMKQVQYNARLGSLMEGDVILLMSDGMPELQNANHEMYGYERMCNRFKAVARKSPQEIISDLKDECLSWANYQDPDDDVTFVVIKVK